VQSLPALDAHAHISSSRRLREAVILAVTNSTSEFDRLQSGPTLVPGVGCHPSDVAAQASFDEAQFMRRLTHAALVGEVGLDGGSVVSSDQQGRVCRAILELARRSPCFVSLHSVRSHSAVLDLLDDVAIAGPILHWWTGSDPQTRRAISRGCWFSVSPGMLRRPDQISRLPRERVLTETDAPVGNGVAGRTENVESALAAAWGCDIEDTRAQIWRNFAELVSVTGTRVLLSAQIRSVLDAIAQ
jgi:TatD DNase family protein